MRDIATINAIGLMIRHRQEVADIPNHCEGRSGLISAIRRFCEKGQAAFDEETERHLSDEDRIKCIPDWDALAEIAIALCRAEKG